jgi:hypothetical protein
MLNHNLSQIKFKPRKKNSEFNYLINIVTEVAF